MYLFAGKFSHTTKKYADDELWTVTFPGAIRKDSDTIVICQWTETGDGKKKHNDAWKGKITKADKKESGEISIEIFKDDPTLYYWFQGDVSSGIDRIDLKMKNRGNKNCGPVSAKIIHKAD